MDLINDFGILLPTRGVLVYADGSRPRVELNWQMAETVERLGYHSVWVGDSVTSKPRLEPLTIMSALAARTQRVRIGTAVMLSALRHPVHLAHALATIDNVSNGRTILGAGAGRGDNQMYVDEHEVVGIPIKERADRMEEGIRIMRSLWSGENVTFEGDYYPLHDVTLEPHPLQDPLPIWISSNWVRRGLKRVAEMGDAWITNVPSVELFSRCWERVQENAANVGRDATDMPRALYISVNLNEEADALAEGDQFMQAYYSRPYEAVSRQLLCVFGPPDKCIESINTFREAGVTYFIVRFASPNQMEQLNRFTKYVLPHVR
jgi:alkanesulfonate monooxygenase SsuD/methylene tetrahydromethanopterin reductase-like flavin-dependent oxidoreductase (luciferase family)